MPNSLNGRLRFPAAIFASVAYLLGIALLAGCAQQSGLKAAAEGATPRKQSYTRVLVVGVTPHLNQRCAFEFFMVSQLSSDTVEAIRSCDAVTQKDPLTLASIEQAVAATQADAVLATSLVSRDYELKKGGDRDTRGNASYKATDAGYATGYYGVYGVPVIYGEFVTAPPMTTAQGTVSVSSRFFETGARTLLSTFETKVKKIESTDTAMHDFAAKIAEQLRREGLTR